MARPLIRILCLPDIDKPIGGVKQLYRHVEHLCKAGYDAAILTLSDSFRPSWFSSDAPTISLRYSCNSGELKVNNCILVVPETYIDADFRDFYGLDLSGFARVVFNQNAYYSFGESSFDTLKLSEFYHSPNVIHVLSVSEDSHDFISLNLGVDDSRCSRIVNAIEPSFFPSDVKKNTLHWMPRKNPNHSLAVIAGLQLMSLKNSTGWNGEALVNLSHLQIAHKLNSARIFLSFGHPEGFGLPVAEAMASGCWVVGYSGGGAKELFRLGASHEIQFGDWRSFNIAIRDVFDFYVHSPREALFRLTRQSVAVRELYSRDMECNSVLRAWNLIVQGFISWVDLYHPY